MCSGYGVCIYKQAVFYVENAEVNELPGTGEFFCCDVVEGRIHLYMAKCGIEAEIVLDRVIADGGAELVFVGLVGIICVEGMEVLVPVGTVRSGVEEVVGELDVLRECG